MCEEVFPTYNCIRQTKTMTIDERLEALIQERNELAEVASGQADKIDALQQQLDALQQQIYQVRDAADDKAAGVNALTAKIAELIAELEATKSTVAAPATSEPMTYQEVINAYKVLPFDQQIIVFQSLFNLGAFGSGRIDDKLMLIALIGSVTLSMRKKNPDMDPLAVINKMLDMNMLNGNVTEEYKRVLALYVAEFLGGVTIPTFFHFVKDVDGKQKVDMQGIKKAVNESLATMTPF